MITVERKALLKAIDLASCVVERRNTIPALGGLKVTANGVLALEGSNLDSFARVEIDYAGGRDSLFLPEPMAVRRALGHAGGDKVRLRGELQDDVWLASGEFAATLKSLPAEDHPGAATVHFPEFSVELGGEALSQIARVLPAISTEMTRYYLNGVCVKRVDEWTWRFAATDGHRLMVVDVPLPGASGAIPDGTILPREWIDKAIALFVRSREAVILRFGNCARRNEAGPDLALEPAGLRVEMAGTLSDCRLTLASKLIDGSYPDYTRVIPSQAEFALTMERRALVRAIETVSALGDGKIRAVSLTVGRDPQIVVALHSAVVGVAQTRVAAERRGAVPDDFKIGFNAGYLLSMLGSLRGDTVELSLGKESDPALVTDPADTAFRGVLMPMRV